MLVTRIDVDAAVARISGHVRRTPAMRADSGAWLKLEYLQHTGSFKARGALNRVLSAQESGELHPGTGIVVASGGNAGLALAYAAAKAEVPATVFVPESAPAVKVQRLKDLGATVIPRGAEYALAYEASLEHAAQTGDVHCHAYDQPAMVAGAGMIGLELWQQVSGEVDTVLIAVGGGGLMGGVAAALEGSARVIAVEPQSCPTLHAALEQGGPVDIAVAGVAADSLGARRLGGIAYDVAVRAGVQSVLVTDDAIVAARRWLWDEHRILVEHGAAATIAALRTGAYTPAEGERVAIVLCGANTDPGAW